MFEDQGIEGMFGGVENGFSVRKSRRVYNMGEVVTSH